ncbi:hypothetical protein C0992_001300, partial [Termitomyces sp. T32_za158]
RKGRVLSKLLVRREEDPERQTDRFNDTTTDVFGKDAFFNSSSVGTEQAHLVFRDHESQTEAEPWLGPSLLAHIDRCLKNSSSHIGLLSLSSNQHVRKTNRREVEELCTTVIFDVRRDRW